MTSDFSKAVFVTLAADRRDFRFDRPIVVFAGRSNAGKSTLINLLCSQKNLMKTSAKPGKTRLVNYALIEDTFYLADVPGYGFEEQRDYFEKLMNGFFEVSGKKLKGLVLVVDSRRGILDSDRDMLRYVADRNIGILIVLTKVDKLNTTERKEAIQRVREEYPEANVVPSSTRDSSLLDTIRNEVTKLARRK